MREEETAKVRVGEREWERGGEWRGEERRKCVKIEGGMKTEAWCPFHRCVCVRERALACT
jgi:hypothetical protein